MMINPLSTKRLVVTGNKIQIIPIAIILVPMRINFLSPSFSDTTPDRKRPTVTIVVQIINML